MLSESYNLALADEIEAINSIYGPDTIRLTSEESAQSVEAVLTLPDKPFSFKLSFERNYPETQPTITGVHSVAEGAKGDGKIVEGLLEDTLQRVWVPGQVCLFDLLEAYALAEQDEDKDKDDD